MRLSRPRPFGAGVWGGTDTLMPSGRCRAATDQTMSATSNIFHTATYEHHVPGESVELSAVSYDLQYTKPHVEAFVARNPASETDSHAVRIGEREFVRVNLSGAHPTNPSRRICTIGVGDGESRAERAANDAWFDFHASTFFTGEFGAQRSHTLALQILVPGVPTPRATIVGVLYDLEYMRPLVEAAVARNSPMHDEVQVVEIADFTLMRVNLFGLHPLEPSRRISVGGIADRHYRAVAAAEQAWVKHHAALLFGAQVLSAQ